MGSPTGDGLRVIALVSGGKDSFYSILHCQANGHRVVALANLFPASPSSAAATDNAPGRPPHGSPIGSVGSTGPEEADLNSFMYQTVGHQIIPLYAQATGLPLYRQAIVGTAVDSAISYQDPHPSSSSSVVIDNESCDQDVDETESLVPLLRSVLRDHPDANALCTGAILSTYQRTRVESVALRLGLAPLGYLWQYTELPGPYPSAPLVIADDAQLLRDMAAAGLEARVVKVASAGLDEDFLWANVTSEEAVQRVKRALRRFGGGGRGSVLGEGGEFETLVVDGPTSLFKGRIVVDALRSSTDRSRDIVREGGGSAWLKVRDAHVEMKNDKQLDEVRPNVRIPDLWDQQFRAVLGTVDAKAGEAESLVCNMTTSGESNMEHKDQQQKVRVVSTSQQWCFVGGGNRGDDVTKQTEWAVHAVRNALETHMPSLPARAITNTIIVLRDMADFPTVNKIYTTLFREPNPPSRVTISCGELLPPNTTIAIYLTVHPGLQVYQRQGLHVQSRSYWAPANIGPYSQAISYPLIPPEISGSLNVAQAVSIAGQIPLYPASMSLPPASDTSVQVVLALQHLWRIGIERRVRWWTSAVAYFPRTSSSDEMKEKAVVAARAWKAAHTWSEDSAKDTSHGGPDIWDRKFNPEYQSFATEDPQDANYRLPDWTTVLGDLEDGLEDDDDATELARREREKNIPRIFSAELEELPRQAGVEWHAHLGLTKIEAGSVRVVSCVEPVPNPSPSTPTTIHVQHVLVDADTSLTSHPAFIQSIVAIPLHGNCTFLLPADATPASSCVAVAQVSSQAVSNSLRRLGLDVSFPHSSESPLRSSAPLGPHLMYLDGAALPMMTPGETPMSTAIVPCRSLWDEAGRRLAMVAVFETRLGPA